MVTAQTQFSLAHARSYFAEHLAIGDYYSADPSSAGEWFGRGAKRLGFHGIVGEESFLRLGENRHPTKTGEPCTLRLNTTRVEEGMTEANHRVFDDFTFSPPKSVSIPDLFGARLHLRRICRPPRARPRLPGSPSADPSTGVPDVDPVLLHLQINPTQNQ